MVAGKTANLKNSEEGPSNNVMTTETIDLSGIQIHDKDTGSADVQIARLTQRINHLAAHLESNHKDNHSRRGLIGMVSRRRKLLKYLREQDEERYQKILKALNLRK